MFTIYRSIAGLAAIIGVFLLTLAPTTVSSAAAEDASTITITWSPEGNVQEGDVSYVQGEFATECKRRVVELMRLENDEWVVIGSITLTRKYRDFTFSFYHQEAGEEAYTLAFQARPKCGPMSSSTATYTVA